MSAGPIYIGGVSYSGKTQLRLALNAHPDILITRRTYLWRRFFGRYGDLSQPANLERCLAGILALPGVQALQPDPERIRAEFAAGEPRYARLFAVIHRQHAERQGKTRWGDQQSLSECDAGLVLSAEPEALFLHVVRSPYERIAESLARSRRGFGKVGWETALWRLSARCAVRNRTRFPDRYRVVRWEELSAGSNVVLAEVCEFLRIESTPEMAAALAGVSAVPVTGTGLSDAERRFISRWAGPDMQALGYSPEPALHPAGGQTPPLLDDPLNTAGAVLWQVLRRKSVTALTDEG